MLLLLADVLLEVKVAPFVKLKNIFKLAKNLEENFYCDANRPAKAGPTLYLPQFSLKPH